jgi:hypothetical protein
MRFTVTYDNGEWVFEVASSDGEPAYFETFEVEDLDEAVEQAAELLSEIRNSVDPLADLFDEDE